ncbi:MAG: dTDP-4-dehydrorhamnose reductase [Solirubrobacteraceae bacterium]|jgi:dTDP-4-dehydrorhamnose reductase
MRILVTGAAGMLAQDVIADAQARGHEVLAPDERDLDVCDRGVLDRVFAELLPEAVVNCAAWTNVDAAESSEAAALVLNGEAPGLLAQAANAAGAMLVHISTDYVFDGSATAPYVESDAPAPRTAYGRTKLAGERAVLAAGGAHAIVRTAWLYGVGGRNFVATMLGLARDGREEVAVVADQIGSPTYSGHLAHALVEIAERRLSGLMHVAGGGQCSWADLAQAAFVAEGLECEVRPVTTAEFPRPAPRPAWSVIVSERSDVPRLPAWREGLADYLAQASAVGSR